MKVALTGATGFIGSHVLTDLYKHGHDVTALVRDGDQADVVASRGATPVVVDLYDRPTVVRILGDADGAIHTASPGAPGPVVSALMPIRKGSPLASLIDPAVVASLASPVVVAVPALVSDEPAAAVVAAAAAVVADDDVVVITAACRQRQRDHAERGQRDRSRRTASRAGSRVVHPIPLSCVGARGPAGPHWDRRVRDGSPGADEDGACAVHLRSERTGPQQRAIGPLAPRSD